MSSGMSVRIGEIYRGEKFESSLITANAAVCAEGHLIRSRLNPGRTCHNQPVKLVGWYCFSPDLTPN